MIARRSWRAALGAAVLTLALSGAANAKFVENTVTDGEIPGDLDGVWVVVSEIHLNPPSPTPTPGALASGSPATASPTPAASPSTAASPSAQRVFNAVHLWKVTHAKKPEVDARRDREKAMLQASIDKANAIIAKEAPDAVQTETGDVESSVKVLAPEDRRIVKPVEGDAVEIYLLDVELPKAITESVDKAQKAQKPWVPTDKERALLKSSWQSLKPNPREEYSRIDWKVVEAKRFDQGLSEDATVKGSDFAITADAKLLPRPGQPTSNILVYGVREQTPTQLSGGHVRAMMASAPFPIPINMVGGFTMYRIADLPKEDAAKSAAAASTASPAKSPSPGKSPR
jgi:hypothetical protein